MEMETTIMKTSHLNYKELIDSYGVSRNILNSVLANNFHIDDKYLDALECYRVQHYTGSNLKFITNTGVMLYKDKECCLIYHNCTRAQAIAAKEIRISFRAAKEEYNLPAYALVQIVST